MPTFVPVPLTPVRVFPRQAEFTDICRWPFADAFVKRLLAEDVPRRVRFGDCRVWLYFSPEGEAVGFGTLDVSDEYAAHAGGKPHPYIPLLAVRPGVQSRGYGTSILRHLIAEASVLASRPQVCHDVLFLDVYTTSTDALKLYAKNDFQAVPTDEPLTDPAEGGKEYLVMARRVSVAAG